MKHHSLRFKMTLALVMTVASAIFLSWLINKFFLPSYYQYSKLKTLDMAYEQIYSLLISSENVDTDNEQNISEDEKDYGFSIYKKNDFALPESSIISIYKVADENNIKVHIFNTRNTGSDRSVVLFSNASYEYEIIDIFNVLKYYILDHRLLGKKTERLKVTNDYDVYKMFDYNKDSFYIDLVGVMDNGTYILIRANFESIQESANIANKFFSYVGIAAVIISALLMFIISRSFTKPLCEMSKIAKRMTDLDFEVYYPVDSNDEIGELGSSLNKLSKKLEVTISELKSANNELLTDIEKKIEIDEMRKDFLSNVTHELKTPIALIQGYAEGLKENINDDAESREFYCEVIVDEALKMNSMVKKLLSLNQIESGKSLEMERFNIIALINSVIQSFDIIIKQKNITVHFEERDAVYVWADEYLIEEAFTNYISNAINHVKGANIIEIKLIKSDDIVRTAVFNTGELIPDDEIDKIWIKFHKVDKARTREYGGNGIGLSIVKAIMESHNKDYGVVNHVSGVEFWFELDAHA